MTTTLIQWRAPWIHRLLAGVLVVFVTLAAVPALAACCADRCHEDTPPAAAADHCDCNLADVEYPVDVHARSAEPPVAPTVVVPVPPSADPPAVAEPPPVPAIAPPGAVPDRTVVLRI